MVLCKFFQQGYCRYGQSCRFEHSAPQYGGSTVSPLLRQNPQPSPNITLARTAPANNQFRATKKDAADILTIISQDINEAVTGGVWPLSCYNFWPAITYGNTVPGLEDLSPEEMRHLQMQAQATGTFEACNQQIQQMYQQARARFNSLKTQSPETLNIIESMTRCSKQSQSPFSSGSSTVQDSWPTSATSPFAAGHAATFGGTSAAAISGQVDNSGFGSAPRSAASSFSFKQEFSGTNNQQSSGFGSPPQFQSVPQKSSIFGGATQPTQASTFGANAQTHGNFGSSAPPGSIFGGATSQQNSQFGVAPGSAQSGGNIFGGSAAAVPAATTTPSAFSFSLPNTFGSSSNVLLAGTSSPFGTNAIGSPNVFGGSGGQGTGSIFGGSVSAPQNVNVLSLPANPVPSNSTLFTPLDRLSEEERKEFETETFTLGRIPTNPPPKELC